MKLLLGLITVAVLSASAFGQSLLNATRGIPQANEGTTGTTLYSTATVNASGQAILATTANTTVPVRIVVGGAGTTGNATLASTGTLAPCTMDTTIASGAGNDYVVASTTTGGQCHPQSAAPSAGTWVIGWLHDGSTTSGSTALVHANGFIYGGGAGGSGTVSPNTGTAGAVAYYPAAASSTTVNFAPAAVADANGLNVGTNWFEFGPSLTATSDLGLVRAGVGILGISNGANRGFGGWLIQYNTSSCIVTAPVSFGTTATNMTGCGRTLPAMTANWIVRCIIPWTFTAGSGTSTVTFGITYTGTPVTATTFSSTMWGPTATTAPYFQTQQVSASGSTNLIQNATVTINTSGMYSTTLEGALSSVTNGGGTFNIFAMTSAGTGSILAGASCRIE